MDYLNECENIANVIKNFQRHSEYKGGFNRFLSVISSYIRRYRTNFNGIGLAKLAKHCGVAIDTIRNYITEINKYGFAFYTVNGILKNHTISLLKKKIFQRFIDKKNDPFAYVKPLTNKQLNEYQQQEKLEQMAANHTPPPPPQKRVIEPEPYQAKDDDFIIHFDDETGEPSEQSEPQSVAQSEQSEPQSIDERNKIAAMLAKCVKFAFPEIEQGEIAVLPVKSFV